MRIAALLTCFNRKDKTIACLESLLSQNTGADIGLDIHLTDDGSKDGTAEAVSRRFPQIHVYEGTGNLYWAGGMRFTWKKALSGNYDYYLLLNDDTILQPDSVPALLKWNEEMRKSSGTPVISIGTTGDPGSKKISYGGKKIRSRFAFRYTVVFNENEPIQCDLGNANIMLVPKEIVDRIGILSDRFTHGIADYDYTLRAKAAGHKSFVAPGILGYCSDDHGNNWLSNGTTLKQRLKYLYSPKGLAYKEYLYFIRTHFIFHYPLAFCKLWIKTLFPFLWDSFKSPSHHNQIQ
jgi:GT2 family glycosyltransferase